MYHTIHIIIGRLSTHEIQYKDMMHSTLQPLLAFSIMVVFFFPSSFSSFHWRCHALVVVNPSFVIPLSRTRSGLLLVGGRTSSSCYARKTTFHRRVAAELSASTTTTTEATSSATRATKRVGINSRGAKMNEIDFTLAPTDVSLSRCYQLSARNYDNSNSSNDNTTHYLLATMLTTYIWIRR